MSRRDCSTRIDKDTQKRLDEMEFLNRKVSYSNRVKILLDFHDKYKKEYKEWIKKNQIRE